MNWREFLKPDWGKIIIIISLIILSLWLWFSSWGGFMPALPPWYHCCNLPRNETISSWCEIFPNEECCHTDSVEELCTNFENKIRGEAQEKKVIKDILLAINWPLKIEARNAIINISLILLDIGWLYFLSCLIVWIYNKVKKK